MLGELVVAQRVTEVHDERRRADGVERSRESEHHKRQHVMLQTERDLDCAGERRPGDRRDGDEESLLYRIDVP